MPKISPQAGWAMAGMRDIEPTAIHTTVRAPQKADPGPSSDHKCGGFGGFHHGLRNLKF